MHSCTNVSTYMLRENNGYQMATKNFSSSIDRESREEVDRIGVFVKTIIMIQRKLISSLLPLPLNLNPAPSKMLPLLFATLLFISFGYDKIRVSPCYSQERTIPRQQSGRRIWVRCTKWKKEENGFSLS